MDRGARHLRRLLAGLCLAGSPLAGCAGPGRLASAPERAAPARPAAVIQPPAPIQRVGHETPAPAHFDALPKEVPITLDAVLRLAEQSNAKIGLAREKLYESQLNAEQTCNAWMPQVYAGLAYYRHEGGIQDFQGHLVHSSTGAVMPGVQLKSEWDLRETTFRQIDAERKIWQQKAELSQVNNEVLLEAATTYIDLLTARRAEGLARQLERYERKLLERTRRIAKFEAAADALVEGLRSSVSQREYQAAQFRQQGNAASAKLVYLLGLPPLTCLVPVDPVLVPIELLDTSPPTEALVEQALTTGPGIRELTGLLNTIQLGLDKSYGRQNLLPTVELCLYEGPFGAGPGASLSWDNRFDAGLQLKWNLTALLRAEEQRQIARSKLEQTRWTLHDVKNRLAAGVQEAKDTILHTREQLGISATQIRQASESYRLSDRRVEDGVKGASPTEVVSAIRALEQAHFNYVQTTRDHNKAQVRLLLLAGHGPAQERKLAPPVQLPPPPPLKEKRDPDRDEKDRKDEDKPEKIDPPKEEATQSLPPGMTEIRIIPLPPQK